MTISTEVWQYIDRDPSIRLDLERGLVNVRALARMLSKQGVAGGEDALISAIRRYPRQSAVAARYEQARKIVSQSRLSTRSHIVSIALSRGAGAQEVLPRLFSCVNYEKGETLRIVQGEESIKIIVDERNLSRLLEIIPKKIVLKVLRGLAEINMHLHPEAVETPGIILVLSSEMARNGINMYEVMSCVPEMLIFVQERQLLDAYQVLFDLCHPEK